MARLQGFLGEMLDASKMQTDDPEERTRHAGFGDACENVLDFLAQHGYPWTTKP